MTFSAFPGTVFAEEAFEENTVSETSQEAFEEETPAEESQPYAQTDKKEAAKNGTETADNSESVKNETAARLEMPGTGKGTGWDYRLKEEQLKKAIAEAAGEESTALKKELEEVQKKLEALETVEMFRLYNPNSGEHFYTQSVNERDTLVSVGWKDEGIGWYAPKNSGDPVYRLYNPNGEHHYTLSLSERDALVGLGWKDEGIGWKSYDAEDTVNAAVLYRQYNPHAYKCNHNYTVSQNEANTLISYGWKDEGTAWVGIQPFTRVVSADGARYYSSESTAPLTGWKSIEGSMVYLDPARNGLLTTGPLKIDGAVYLFDLSGHRMYGLQTWLGNTYWLDETTGQAKHGLQTLSKEQADGKPRIVYFDENGVMVKNTSVNGMEFDANGYKTNHTAEELLSLHCEEVYSQVGRDLRAVFDWTTNHITYQAFSPQWVTPPEGRTHEQNFALIGIETGRGNCYTYASTFMTLAKNLGYEARLVRGSVKTVNGRAEHGWTEVNVNGTWYIFDACFAKDFNPNMCYMQRMDKPTFVYYR